MLQQSFARRKSSKDAQQTLESAVRELPDDAEASHGKPMSQYVTCRKELPTMPLQIWRRLLSIHEQLKDSKGQHLCHRRLVRDSDSWSRGNLHKNFRR